jgi:DNA-binding NarL/FixJ family response regulator
MNTYRTLIADLNPQYIPELRRDLEQLPALLVVGEAHDGVEALCQVVEATPDFLIMSTSMMKLMGWEVLERIPLEVMPRWIIVTGSYGEEDERVQMCLARGAHQYVIKGHPWYVLRAMKALVPDIHPWDLLPVRSARCHRAAG